MADEVIWNVLNRDLFFFKKANKVLEVKTEDKMVALDPETGASLFDCAEPNLGGLTKAARALGGHYDVATAFNVQGVLPNQGRQLFRIERVGAVFMIGTLATTISDHNNEALGSFKQKALTLGKKYEFTTTRSEPGFLLEIKSSFLTGDSQWFIDGKLHARRINKWKGAGAAQFKSAKCAYALEILPETPKNNRLRPIFLAFAAAYARMTRR